MAAGVGGAGSKPFGNDIRPVAAFRRRCQPLCVDPNPLKGPVLARGPGSRQSRIFLPRSQAVHGLDSNGGRGGISRPGLSYFAACADCRGTFAGA